MSKKRKLTLDDMPTGDSEGEYTEEFRKSLLRSAQDLEAGRVVGISGKALYRELKGEK